ncbi:MAG: hypothetical protein HYY93_04605 [Planctomycetes bacterium]|nr:hypothetical protein [Planctomycetota bacterium]
MRVRVWCENGECGGSAWLTLERVQSPCPRCGVALAIQPTAEARERNTIDLCQHCAGPNLYTEVHFPQSLGCLTIGLSAVLAILFARATYGLSFLAIMIADLVLYRVLPRRIVCYKCVAYHLDALPHPKIREHNLLISGKYADRKDVGGPAGHPEDRSGSGHSPPNGKSA